jgi:hypothetical protein
VAASDLDTAISNLEARIATLSSGGRASGSIEGATVSEESVEDLTKQLERLYALRAKRPGAKFEVHSRWVP